MKKTEAISILATSVRPREPKDRARYDEAVKMAIEALKCSETPKSSEQNAETAQADHIADSGKKVERTAEIAQNVQNGDLIQRKTAIEALRKCQTYLFDEKDPDKKIELGSAERAIEDLPSAAPSTAQTTAPSTAQTTVTTAPSTGGWIPCSERLPEERGFYLTTTKDKAVYCDHWNEDNFDRTEMVIAWQPLPEPYRGGNA